jgi:hypothetical protein
LKELNLLQKLDKNNHLRLKQGTQQQYHYIYVVKAYPTISPAALRKFSGVFSEEST